MSLKDQQLEVDCLLHEFVTIPIWKECWGIHPYQCHQVLDNIQQVISLALTNITEPVDNEITGTLRHYEI